MESLLKKSKYKTNRLSNELIKCEENYFENITLLYSMLVNNIK